MPAARVVIDCPRAKSDMTPCAARDGNLAIVDDSCLCVGCEKNVADLFRELVSRYVERAGSRVLDH